MVLIRWPAAVVAAVLAGAALAACNQSLFDNHGSGGGGDGGTGDGSDGTPVPSSCPDGCLGDAAADYDGTPAGSNGRWRYLEDLGRSWQPMTPAGMAMTGQDPANHIATCRSHDAPACAVLPGALLLSAVGDSTVDPALEFTAPAAQVIQLSLRAYLSDGPDQTIQIYRNSREDLLFSAPLTQRVMVEHAIVLDALVGDRFLVAISGIPGSTDVALELYVNATADGFPRDCQLATPFAAQTTTVADHCGGPPLTYNAYNPVSRTSTPAAVQLVAGPFPELPPAIAITMSHFLERNAARVIDWSHDVTVQFWIDLGMLHPGHQAFLFADLDPEQCNGIQLWFDPGSGSDPRLLLRACTDPNAIAFDMTSAAYPSPMSWHFVRVVRTSDHFALCVDGAAALATLAAPLDRNPTANQVEVGKENVVTPTDTYLDGQVDDLRAISAALPCQ